MFEGKTNEWLYGSWCLPSSVLTSSNNPPCAKLWGVSLEGNFPWYFIDNFAIWWRKFAIFPTNRPTAASAIYATNDDPIRFTEGESPSLSSSGQQGRRRRNNSNLHATFALGAFHFRHFVVVVSIASLSSWLVNNKWSDRTTSNKEPKNQEPFSWFTHYSWTYVIHWLATKAEDKKDQSRQSWFQYL